MPFDLHLDLFLRQICQYTDLKLRVIPPKLSLFSARFSTNFLILFGDGGAGGCSGVNGWDRPEIEKATLSRIFLTLILISKAVFECFDLSVERKQFYLLVFGLFVTQSTGQNNLLAPFSPPPTGRSEASEISTWSHSWRIVASGKRCRCQVCWGCAKRNLSLY